MVYKLSWSVEFLKKNYYFNLYPEFFVHMKQNGAKWKWLKKYFKIKLESWV